MAKPWLVKDAVAYLQKARVKLPTDGEIAERATTLLRAWGINGGKDRVSRPMVNMLRNGTARNAAGVKARAIWEVLVELKAVPAVPEDVYTRHASTPARAARKNWMWKQKYRALLARVTGHELEPEEVKEVPMLTKPMLQYFGFERNPVFDEIRSSRDLWWGRQHREAKSILIDAAEEARFVRLAGRRGAGKSLVWNDVREVLRTREDIILAEPSAVISGVLSETHLITAVIQAIKRKVDGRDEIFAESQSPAKRSLAMRYLLLQQKRANRKVVLVIDEAHELKAPTFLALKRFLDEVDSIGRRLLGIILIGQNPEAAYNPRARDLSEVVLRLQTYRIQPMSDEIPEYLKWKIHRANAKVGDVITPSALKALATRCPYPLDANALFAQLLIDAYGDRKKPIGRDLVETAAPEEPAEEIEEAAQ